MYLFALFNHWHQTSSTSWDSTLGKQSFSICDSALTPALFYPYNDHKGLVTSHLGSGFSILTLFSSFQHLFLPSALHDLIITLILKSTSLIISLPFENTCSGSPLINGSVSKCFTLIFWALQILTLPLHPKTLLRTRLFLQASFLMGSPFSLHQVLCSYLTAVSLCSCLSCCLSLYLPKSNSHLK